MAVKNDGTNNPKVAATIDGNHRGLCVGSADDSRRNERTSLSQARTLPKCRCLLWLGHGHAKTLALDTKTNHVLTMTAEFGPPQPNASPGPAGRPARGPMIPGSFSILMVGK